MVGGFCAKARVNYLRAVLHLRQNCFHPESIKKLQICVNPCSSYEFQSCSKMIVLQLFALVHALGNGHNYFIS